MIRVNELYKGYEEDKYIVKNVSFQVEQGSIHGLIGHNGSGKTTIIKCLTGIYPPDRGQILIDGKEVYDNPEAKNQVGYVADSNQMFGNYTVDRMVKMYEKVFPNFDITDFHALNRIFQVPMRNRIAHLSKGQQMRISFMLNLARRPKVLILDEPTSGLDANAKKDLLDCLVNAVENRDMTVLISSHHLNELEKICDKVTMIRNGEIYLDDSLNAVTGQVKKYQVVFPNGAPQGLYSRPGVLNVSNVGSVYTLVATSQDQTFADDMRAGGAVLVEEMRVGLEESFIYMNQRGGQLHE
ncbi:MAG: ABC transporter ATP-binding protein [Eubacterium sp.]|nr:ABC transporter ATP-binding protein [Eubacterium sp.]